MIPGFNGMTTIGMIVFVVTMLLSGGISPSNTQGMSEEEMIAKCGASELLAHDGVDLKDGQRLNVFWAGDEASDPVIGGDGVNVKLSLPVEGQTRAYGDFDPTRGPEGLYLFIKSPGDEGSFMPGCGILYTLSLDPVPDGSYQTDEDMNLDEEEEVSILAD